MRIAIFQVDYALIGSTRDLVNGLVGLGFAVDLYTSSDADKGLIDLSAIKGNVIFLQLGGVLGLYFRRIREKLARSFALSVPINPWFTNFAALNYLKKNSLYDIYIGIEKPGLELATTCSRFFNTPVIYYSLELYIEDHPKFRSFAWSRRSEIRCHGRAAGTIIQDQYRWQSLMDANRLTNKRVFFLPVGTCPENKLGKRNHSSGRESPVNDMFVVLYVGQISEQRFSYELILTARTFTGDIFFHLHGPLGNSQLRAMINDVLPANAKITTELLSEAELLDLVSSASIGLALYLTKFDNDRLTAYSSQKVAYYLQMGIPIIVFRTVAYEDLIGRFHCGEMITSIADLSQAIERIRKNYQAYSDGARKAYTSVYDLDRYWESLGRFLNSSIENNAV